MHSKSDNAKIMMSTETNDIINEFFKSSLKKYQEGLETKMKGSDFVLKIVNLLYHSLHKISLNRSGSYQKSPKWIRDKGAIINPKSKDNICFRDCIVASLNHERIPNHPERISNLERFFNQYNWKETEFPSHLKDGKKFEQNIKRIALNIFFVPYNTKQIRFTYKSKYSHKLIIN